MKRFLKTHYEFVLVAIAFFLLAVVATALLWEMKIISVNLGKAIGSSEVRPSPVQFDLDGAKALLNVKAPN